MSGAYNFCDTVHLMIQNHSLSVYLSWCPANCLHLVVIPPTQGDITRHRNTSVCLSASRWQRGAAAQAIGALAACRWPASRDVRTADWSADGRRSAASRTVISGGHIVSPDRQTDTDTHTTTDGLELSAGRPPRTAGLRVLQTASENLAFLQILACPAH